MAFLPTNASQVQQFAVGLYGIQVGTQTMTSVQADIVSAGGLGNALNAYYAASFGSQKTTDVAASVAKNLGLTGQAATDGASYIAAALNAAPANARGVVIQNVLNLFANLSSDATYGAAATTFNQQVAAAVTTPLATDSVVVPGVVAPAIFTMVPAVENLSGGAGADIFNAVISDTAASTDTLTSSDVINGGSGNDTLNLTVTGAATAVTVPAAGISNVETFNVRALQTTAATVTTVNTATYSGLTAVNADRATSAITITGLPTGGSTGLIGNGSVTNGALIAGYTATATGAATLNVSGGTVGTSAVTLTGAALTSTVVNTTGSVANEMGAIATPATSTSLTINAGSGLSASFSTGAETAITVTGAAATGLALTTANDGVQPAVVIGTPVSTVKTIDASAMTAGGVGTTLIAGITSFKGGQGTDKVTTVALTSTTASIIDAGAGTDTLVVAASTDVDSAAKAAKYANFEVLDVGAQTADLALFTKSTITNIKVGGDATLSNLTAAQAANIDVYANASGTFGVKGATDVGQIDTLKLNVSDNISTSNTITLANITAAGVENIAVNAVDKVTISSLAGAAAATNFTFTGGAATNVKTAALAINSNTAVDATALTGTFTFDASAGTGNGLRITGSTTKVDTITGSAQADIITGGSAADVLKGLTGNDVIDGGTGNDAITGNKGADKMTGGDGTDTFTIRPGDSYSFATAGTAHAMKYTLAGLDQTAGAGTFTSTIVINGISVTTAAISLGANAAGTMDNIRAALKTAIEANAELSSYVTVTNAAAGTQDITLTSTGSAGLTTVAPTYSAMSTTALTAAATNTYANVTSSTAASGVLTTDTITDLNLGGVDAASSVDKINISGTTSTALTVVPTSALSGADLSAAVIALFNVGGALNGTTDTVGLFTYGTDTYLIGNIGASNSSFGAGTVVSTAALENSTSDFIIKVTGVTGTLDASDFTFV